MKHKISARRSAIQYLHVALLTYEFWSSYEYLIHYQLQDSQSQYVRPNFVDY
jgi:hypothetical protein